MVCFFSGCRAIRNHQGSFGEIKLTIRYAGLRKKLLVVVESCRFVLKKSLIVVFFKIIPPKKLLCFLQKGLVPLQRERHGFVCPPVPAPWSGLPSPQEDTRPEEDRVPILQWEVSRKVFFLICQISHSVRSQVFMSSVKRLFLAGLSLMYPLQKPWTGSWMWRWKITRCFIERR